MADALSSSESGDECAPRMEAVATMVNREKQMITDEKTPLLLKMKATLAEAYSLEDAVVWEEGIVVDYQPFKLSTLRVFFAWRGTVIHDMVLFFELFVLTIVFLLVALPLYVIMAKDMGLVSEADRIRLYNTLTEQEAPMRKFSLIMTGLAAFLLSMYTSLMIGRWWAIRTGGVGAMKTAASELTIMVSQFVTQEPHVLSAISRYARASMRLIFIWRRGDMNNDDRLREELVDSGILTDDELDLLVSESWNHNLPESIWTWQVSIIRTLYQDGNIKSDELLVLLLEKCSVGRGGVQCICTHLVTKVPMQYVHLLGFLVKLHNIILAVLMGVLFSTAVVNQNVIVCLQLYARSILLPFLFNGLLVINAELSDPFDGGSADFPLFKYDKSFEIGCAALIETGAKLPPWLKSRQNTKGEH